MVKSTPNEITKPSHYNQYTGFEVMDVCRQLVSPDATPASTWFRGNVFKYLARAGWKVGDGKELQDLEKAAEYLRKEIERVKTRDASLDQQEDVFNAAVTSMVDYRKEQGSEPVNRPNYWTLRCPECDTLLYALHRADKTTVWSCPKGHGGIQMPNGPISAETPANPANVILTFDGRGVTPDRLIPINDKRVPKPRPGDSKGYRVTEYETVDNPDWCGNLECIQHPKVIERSVY